MRLVPLIIVLTVLLELAAIIVVANLIGIGWTILLLLATSVLGGWLVRRESRRTWRALSEALRSGSMPSREMADTVLVWAGGALLFVPGFITDIVGLLAVLPFTRPIARIGLEVIIARRLIASVPGAGPSQPAVPPGQARVRRTQDTSGEVIEGEIIED